MLLMTTITTFVLTVIAVVLPSVSLFAQSKCLSPDEAKAMHDQLNSPRQRLFNKKLHDD
jgi:hypothetical protein